MTPNLILTGYILLAIMHCLLADTRATFRLLTKPVLMPVLIFFYATSGGEIGWVYAALIAAWLGDIALLRFDKASFIAGLVSFLAGHVSMIFAIHSLIPDTASIPWASIASIKLMLAVAAFWYLRPHLGSMQLPVLVYCLVLATKGMVAMALFIALPANTGLLVAAGALIFMLSDLLLAINRFAKPIGKAHFWVMGTYTSAQALIVLGILQLN